MAGVGVRVGRFGESPTRRWIPLLVLAAAMVASLLVLADWSRGQTFSTDELGYASRFGTHSLGHVLLYPPPDKYMIAVPLLGLRALYGTAGLDSYAPYAALGIFLSLLCGGLFYVLARRRVGDFWALPPTVLLLFFGYGWVQMSTAIPSLISLAAGLGALIALDRRDLRGDVCGALLLTVSVASHPEGLAIVVAAAVLIVLRGPPDRWRRAWVFLAPAVLYAIWWQFLRLPGQMPTRTPGAVLTFVGDSLVATVAAVTGLGAILGSPWYDQALGWVAAIALVGAVGWVVATRGRHLPASFWAVTAALITLWVITGLPVLRPADSPRYLYPSAIFLLLVLVESAAAVRLPAWVAWIATGVLGLGLAANLSHLENIADPTRARAVEIRASYGAIEIASRLVQPDYRPLGFLYPPAGEYLAAVHAFGSPAYSPGQLLGLPAATRSHVDGVLVHAMRLRAEPPAAKTSAAAGAPHVDAALQGISKTRRGCVELHPSAHAAAAAPPPAVGELKLPPGGASIRPAGGAQTELRLGRFADVPSVPLAMPAASRGATLAITKDDVALPWRATVYSRGSVSVCGIAGPRAAEP